MIPDEDRPVCDFCDLMIEEDEELTPVTVGPAPEAKTIRAQGLADKTARGAGSLSLSFGMAAMNALEEESCIRVRKNSAVQEVESVGGDSGFVSDPPEIQDHACEIETRHDRVGVDLLIKPETVPHEPDARLCPNCAEMMRNL